jgi:hypothetical protein
MECSIASSTKTNLLHKMVMQIGQVAGLNIFVWVCVDIEDCFSQVLLRLFIMSAVPFICIYVKCCMKHFSSSLDYLKLRTYSVITVKDLALHTVPVFQTLRHLNVTCFFVFNDEHFYAQAHLIDSTAERVWKGLVCPL